MGGPALFIVLFRCKGAGQHGAAPAWFPYPQTPALSKPVALPGLKPCVFFLEPRVLLVEKL